MDTPEDSEEDLTEDLMSVFDFNDIEFDDFIDAEEVDREGISVATTEISINKVKLSVERHRLPTGELFMYKLFWLDPKQGPITVIAELIEGTWSIHCQKTAEAVFNRGKPTYVVKTVYYYSEKQISVPNILNLIYGPTDTFVEVSSNPKPIGNGAVEEQITIHVEIDKIIDNFLLKVRNNSFILLQDGEIVLVENQIERLAFVNPTPIANYTLSIYRCGDAFEILTDDYLLVIEPYLSFYSARLVRPKQYQTEG